MVWLLPHYKSGQSARNTSGHFSIGVMKLPPTSPCLTEPRMMKLEADRSVNHGFAFGPWSASILWILPQNKALTPHFELLFPGAPSAASLMFSAQLVRLQENLWLKPNNQLQKKNAILWMSTRGSSMEAVPPFCFCSSVWFKVCIKRGRGQGGLEPRPSRCLLICGVVVSIDRIQIDFITNVFVYLLKKKFISIFREKKNDLKQLPGLKVTISIDLLTLINQWSITSVNPFIHQPGWRTSPQLPAEHPEQLLTPHHPHNNDPLPHRWHYIWGDTVISCKTHSVLKKQLNAHPVSCDITRATSSLPEESKQTGSAHCHRHWNGPSVCWAAHPQADTFESC